MARTIIIDAGSDSVSAGFTDDDAPRVVRTSTVGGKRPIVRGHVADRAAWTQLLRETFAELGVDPAGQNVLLTEAPLTSKADRERMTQVMFEEFHVGGFYVAVQAMLALYSTGRITGIVVDSGYGVSHVVPIYQGYVMPHGVIRLDLAGGDLDAHLQASLAQRGQSVDLETARALKEALCYVAADFEETQGAGAKGPGTHAGITLEKERFLVPEVLFQPALIGMESAGIHETLYRSIMKCEVDVRRELYANIVLAGGTAQLPGFAERMHHEVSILAPPAMRIQMETAGQDGSATWKGADRLSELPHFEQMLITAADFAAHGPAIVHRKCF